jgi:ABC-type antimicrobial peptide transport system permease subunit
MQFAVLRTLGLTRAQLIRLLLGEQVGVYLVGLVGGLALGMLLLVVTLPFLEFSGASGGDTATLGSVPYELASNVTGIGYFYLAMLVAGVLAVVVGARYAAAGLSSTLRLGED